MSAIENLYPEAFEKAEYSIKEILEKTKISRKTFDKYKSDFPDYYRQNSRKEKPNNKMYYRPFVFILCKEIAAKQQSGLKYGEIKKHIEETIIPNGKNKKGKTQDKKTGKTFIYEGLKFENQEGENEEIVKENGRNAISLEKYLELQDQLRNQEKKVFQKEIELERKTGEINTLYAQIEGMKTQIQLLEPPKKIEEVKETPKFKNILELIVYFTIILFGGYGIYFFSQMQNKGNVF